MITLPGKLLGIDYGRKVLGLATCDALGVTVAPLQIIKRRSKKEDFARIAALLNELNAKEIICGVPLPVPGYEGYSQADTVRLWAGRLAAAVPVPVRLWDETLTSEDARRLLAEGGQSRRRVDDAAAAVILQSYLDGLREGFQPPAPVAPVQD